MKTCLFGLVGMSIGAVLFMVGMGHMLIWLAWLIAPLLWYVGFGMVMAWALSRLFATAHDGELDGRMIATGTDEPSVARWALIKQGGSIEYHAQS